MSTGGSCRRGWRAGSTPTNSKSSTSSAQRWLRARTYRRARRPGRSRDVIPQLDQHPPHASPRCPGQLRAGEQALWKAVGCHCNFTPRGAFWASLDWPSCYCHSPMEDSDLLHQIEGILEAAGTPLLAREIAAILKQRGIDIDRSAVNSSLYRRSQQVLVKDAEHRWSCLSSLALQVVDAAGRPLLAREIASELNRRGFKVDRAQVNKSLYRQAQNTLTKDDSHRWSRLPPEAKGSPHPLAFRDTPSSRVPQPLIPMYHPVSNPRPLATMRIVVSIAVVAGLLAVAVAVLLKLA